jgi:hypothetical protein
MSDTSQETATLKKILDRYQQAWRDGMRPAIEAFLSDAAKEAGELDALVELIKADLECRWRGQQSTYRTQGRHERTQPHGSICPLLEDYVERFPHLGRLSELPVHLIVQEYRVRRRWGDRPTAERYVERFGPRDGELLSSLRKIDQEESKSDLRADEHLQKPLRGRVGDYQIVRQVGRGGMGVVYEACHVVHGSRVALKTFRSEFTGALLAFKHEFRTLAELAHPNLIALGELVVDTNPPFFTMEYIDGVTLVDYVRPSFDSAVAPPTSGFDKHRLRSAFTQLARGLQVLHQAGKIHRDIKPNNVLVAHDDRVVLLDFGLAVEADDEVYRNSLQEIAGTPIYMSPEQAAGDSVPLASDWYGFGVMLFQALTGEHPFEAKSADELQEKRLCHPIPEPADSNPEVPEDLNRLCVDLLASEPDLRPAADEIIRRLSGGESHPTRAQVWVGRAEHLAQLQFAFDDARQNRPIAALVSGRSGMGKTALVNRFLKLIQQKRRCVVLRGKCYETESVPFNGFDAVIDALAKYLMRLADSAVERVLPLDIDSLCQVFPALREVPAVNNACSDSEPHPDAQEVRRSGFEAIREVLSRLARYETLLIFIDDIQWGDPDFEALFLRTFRVPKPPNCFVICTYRSEDESSSPCLRAVRLSDKPVEYQRSFMEQREIKLDALSDGEANELARRLLADDQDALHHARAIATESRGEPLFVQVLAEHLLGHRGDRADPTTEPLRLENILAIQIEGLPEEERAVVEYLAAAGRPLPRRTLCELAGLSVGDISHFRNLRLNRFVRSVGVERSDNVDMYHDKIREVIAQKLPADEITRRCQRLADALEATQLESDAEMLADLYSRANCPRKAGSYLASAADQAMQSLAFHQAVALYGRAIDALGESGRREAELRERLGDALAHAGHGINAAHEYISAAINAKDEKSLSLRQRAALRFLTSGHVDEGISTLSGVLVDAGMKLPASPITALLSIAWQRSRLRLNEFENTATDPAELSSKEQQAIEVSWTAAAGLSVVDPIRAAHFVVKNLSLSLKSGEPIQLVRALTAYVGHTAIRGSRGRRNSGRLLVATKRVARSHDTAYSRAAAELARGVIAHLEGRWRAAVRSCDRATKYLLDKSCVDVGWEINTARTFSMWALMYMGDIAELASRQPELLRIAEERNDFFALLNFGTVVTTNIKLAADRPADARIGLATDEERLSDRGFFVQHHNWLLASTFLRLYEGDGAAAWRQIADGWRGYRKSFLGHVQQVRIDFLQTQGRAAIAAAEQSANPRPHLKRAEKIVRRLRRERVKWADALADMLAAGICSVQRDHDATVAHLQAAAKQFNEVQMKLFCASAHLHLEQLLEGDADERRQHSGSAAMTELGIENPSRMANAIVPGFAERKER